MQIKSTLRFYLTPVIVATSKNNTNVGEDVREKEPSHITGGNVD
jgi:hypothetical protein